MIVSCLQWWMTSFSSVHFVCFGEERNMHKCATTSWSSCLWKLWRAGVKHWRTAPHRFYVYRKHISSPRSRNLKVIKKMCTFEVHLCMMYGQLILSGKPFNTFSMARLKYCSCVWPLLPFPIPPRILLYKSLLPRMACIFFSLGVSHHFSPMICDWNGVYIFYSRDTSFMSLIDSPLFVKFSKMANFNFRESWFGFFLFSEIRDQKK
jgi:hypothetical protein